MVLGIYDYLKRRLRSNVVSIQNCTILSDINLRQPLSLESADVGSTQSGNRSIPLIEEQPVLPSVPFRSKIPVLIGRRTGQPPAVGEDRLDVLLKMIKIQNDQVTKRIDRMEEKFDLKHRQITEIIKRHFDSNVV